MAKQKSDWASQLIGAATLFFLGTQSVAAATVTYTNSADYLAALSSAPSIKTETYENLAVNQTINSGDTLNGITYSNFTSAFSGNSGLKNLRISCGEFAGFDSCNLAANRNVTNSPYFFYTDAFTVSFQVPVTAVGVYFNASSAGLGQLFIDTAVGHVGNSFLKENYPGCSTDLCPSYYFVGLISDSAFQTATIGSTLGNVIGFTVDNLTYAPVPEPISTIGFLVLGGFGALTRSRGSRPKRN